MDKSRPEGAIFYRGSQNNFPVESLKLYQHFNSLKSHGKFCSDFLCKIGNIDIYIYMYIYKYL